MQPLLFSKTAKQNLYIWYAVAAFFMALISQGICSPIVLYTANDVLLQDTFLPDLMHTLTTLFQYGFYWVSFAVGLYSIVTYGFSASLAFIWCYLGGSLLFRLFSFLSGGILIGFPTIQSFVAVEIPSMILEIVLDALLGALSCLSIYLIVLKKRKKQDLFPFTCVFDKHNPVLVAALVLAIIPSGTQIFLQLISNLLNIGRLIGFEAILWTLFDYLFDLCSIALGYLAIWLLLGKFYHQDIKKRTKQNETEIPGNIV